MSVHNGHKDFVCSECSYASSHKSNLERHLIRVHGQILQLPLLRMKRDATIAELDTEVDPSSRFRLCFMPYKCLLCQSVFQSQFDYTEHYKFCSNHDELTINAAIALAQLKHSPQFYDNGRIPKLEVSEFVQVPFPAI